MTDNIRAWRRKIKADTTSRTPEPRQSSQSDDRPDYDEPETSQASAATPPPPHRIRPKLASLFSSHTRVPQVSDYEPFLADQWFLDKPPAQYDPDIDMFIRTIHGKLLRNPHEALTPDFNSLILNIIGHCGENLKNIERLEARLMEEVDKQHDLRRRFDEAEKRWDIETKTHLAEIARLRQMIQERGGSTERRRETFSHPEARQSVSALDGQIQDLFSDPRANLRPLSGPVRSLSAAERSSPLVAHDSQKTFTQRLARIPRYKSPSRRIINNATGRVELSEDYYSNFSSMGDFLPDETSEPANSEDMSADPDFAAVRRFAELLARRTSSQVAEILPQVVDLFFSQVSRLHHSRASPTPSPEPSSTQIAAQGKKKTPLLDGAGAPPLRRSKKFESDQRPFSFYVGDDEKLDVPTSRTSEDSNAPRAPNEAATEKDENTPQPLVSKARQQSTTQSDLAPETPSPLASPTDTQPTDSPVTPQDTTVSQVPSTTPLRHHRPKLSLSTSSQKTIILRSPVSAPKQQHSRSTSGAASSRGSTPGSSKAPPAKDAVSAASAAVGVSGPSPKTTTTTRAVSKVHEKVEKWEAKAGKDKDKDKGDGRRKDSEG